MFFKIKKIYMRPSSKVGPVMAGPTGPVPPGLYQNARNGISKRQPGRSKFSIFRARDYEAVTPRDKFCKFIGNFLVLVSPISFGEFFKIWQHSKTRCQFHDERFKFTNQKLQKFLTMKTTYFNITKNLARSHPFLFLLMKLWRSNLPVHKILKHFTEEI